MDKLKFRLAGIKMFVTDVDGTLTDGKILLDPNGNEWKHFHVKDGMGLVLAQRASLIPVIITGRFSRVVELRARELDIAEVHQGVNDKSEKIKELIEKYQINSDQIAYIGDDLNDMEIGKQCGVLFAVADACKELKEIADIITKNKGGHGAVREAIEIILKAKALEPLNLLK